MEEPGFASLIPHTILRQAKNEDLDRGTSFGLGKRPIVLSVPLLMLRDNAPCPTETATEPRSTATKISARVYDDGVRSQSAAL